MIKRLSSEIMMLVLVCMCALMCTGCEGFYEPSYPNYVAFSSENEDDLSNRIRVFQTESDEKYLEFLTCLGPQYEIVGVSTGLATYKTGESYMVTYIKRESYDISKKATESATYKYYLFKTRSQVDYLKFLDELLKTQPEFEIVGTSTRQKTYDYGESYMVTYRTIDRSN